MTEAELLDALQGLGIDEQSVRALPLLPLVQVAWADGEVQAGERALIQKMATERFQLGDEGVRLLENWLRYPPSPEYFERGRAALLAVAGRQGPLDVGRIDDVVELARRVAKAAGGLFGIGAVSRSEAEAIEAIAKALHLPEGAGLDAAEKALVARPGDRGGRVTITFSTSAFDLAPQGAVLELGRDKLAVDREGVTIGSDPRAEVHIAQDPTVAPMHARVFERDRKYYVRDLDSESGTWVDGERVVERRLFGGESLQVGGEATFAFKLLRRIPTSMI